MASIHSRAKSETSVGSTEPPEICAKKYKLNDGSLLPAVGLGTWQGQIGGTSDADRLRESVIQALKSGYRLIDTAQYYGVESIVGEAIRASGVPREEITVITKFWGHHHHDPAAALRLSLEALNIGYIDILLMHWPPAMTPDGQPLGITESPTFVETWKKMEGLVSPQCRSIGVSNFTQKTLAVLLQHATITPVVNQIELHAQNPNRKLTKYCAERNIQVISWSTMGSEMLGPKNEILRNQFFLDIANAHNCSVGVVSLSWAVQRGLAVIPKSSSVDRIKSNIRLVQLTDAEMEEMNTIHEVIGRLRLSTMTPGLIYKGEDGADTILGWSKVDFGWEDESGEWLC